MQDPQSLHKYLYVHGDPTNNIDPRGLFSLVGGLTAMGITVNARGLEAASKAQVALNVGAPAITAALGFAWTMRIFNDASMGRGPGALKRPDAYVLSISTALVASIMPGVDVSAILPNAGVGFTSGVEAVFIADDPGKVHFYSYAGGGFGTAGVSLTASLGAIWGVHQPSDYTGWFHAASLAAGRGRRPAPEIMRLALEGWYVSPDRRAMFGGQLTTFYDPTNFTSGSYGLSFGISYGNGGLGPYQLVEATRSIGYSAMRTWYTYLGSWTLPGGMAAPGQDQPVDVDALLTAVTQNIPLTGSP